MTDARKPATIYDVAKVAGVSHQTVSRLLRGHTGIRSETRSKVLAAIEQLDYRTNITARNLRNGNTGMIALAIPDLNQPYFAELAQSVIMAARHAGLTVFVETTDGDRDRELAVLSGTHSNLVDGVLYAPKSLGGSDLAELSIDFPLVLIGDRIFHSPFDHVTMPNAAGARAAVEHLIATGRRRIAVIGAEPPTEFGAAALRLDGYKQALDAAGLEYDPDLVLYDGEWIRATGAASMQRLLEAGTAFDAVFCFNDALALGALRTMLAAGVRVPEDIAIVGYDDTQDAQYSFPSLSSISPGRDELAQLAVGLLQRRLKKHAQPGEHEELVSGFALEVRESSGPAEISLSAETVPSTRAE